MQSYVHGLFVKQFGPAAVALHSSRGYETYFSKQLLRWTVILSDVLSKQTGIELAAAVRLKVLEECFILICMK
jgi:hypothetical protein